MVLQCASPDAGHRELDGRYHRAFREHVYFLAEERGSGFDRLRTVEASLATSSSLVEDRRRSSVGLVMRGFVTDISDGDSPLLPKVLGRLQSVEASLASLTNSVVEEQAAEDVEESVQAIDLVRGIVRRWNASRERHWQASFVKSYTPCLVGRRPDRLQFLESSVASMAAGC